MTRFQFATLAVLVALTGATADAQTALRDNEAFIDQIGDDNAAAITQTGVANLSGLDADNMLQDGRYNDLSILQIGTGNEIGTRGEGLFQLGRQNTTTVFNSIDITQQSNNNLVGEVDQQSVGSVINGANDMIILQSGGGNNTVETARQFQQSGSARNIMDIAQTGTDNFISVASQEAATDTLGGLENVIRIRITGDRNGRDRLRAPAILPFLLDSGLIQDTGTADLRSNGNFMDILITGSDTAFGIRQGGRDNTVGQITINGDFNDLGIRQDGDQNTVTMTPIDGSNNIVGIDQLGTNLATVDIVGFSDDNTLSIRQQDSNDAFVLIDGDNNEIIVDQNFLGALGGENFADISVQGSDNFVDLGQEGTNIATIAIEGDGNNPALALSSGPAAAGLVSGVYRQSGFDNEIDMSITGNRNSSAAFQTGDLNSILLIVFGDSNEAAFLQNGSGNRADLRQNGVGNVAYIRQ